jgi:4-hydroxy-tetrahydrodipicolinate reductase
LGVALDNTQADVLVDFTQAAAAGIHAESALKRKVSPVIGTTGIDQVTLRDLARLSGEHQTPGMYVPNFAVGAVLMMRFAEMAAKWLPDAEIIELHHDAKEDAPSGTSIRTAEMIAAARTAKPAHKPRPVMKVEGARGASLQDVVIHSVRLKGFVAHQEVIFGGTGEVLTIRHDSTDRKSFMEGVKLCVRQVRGLSGFTIGMDKILFA